MDKVAFRILLIILGVFEVILMVGALLLVYYNKDIPEFVTGAIPSVLTGMLGLAVNHNTEPQQIVNVPGAPVEVTPIAPSHRAEDGVDTLN